MPEITEITPPNEVTPESVVIDAAQQEEIDKINEEVSRLLQATNKLAGRLSSDIQTKAHAEALLAAVESAYLTLGREFNEATGSGCPSGWVQCQDGSCVADAGDCPGGNVAAA